MSAVGAPKHRPPQNFYLITLGIMKFSIQKPLFLSGATGTEIQRRGFPTTLPLWSAQVLFDRPDLLTEIYLDYIRAGADIITTNTFRTQRRTLALAGLADETERINRLAVDLAVAARDAEKRSRPVYIAGCITTLEDCYRPDLVPAPGVCAAEHDEQVSLLAETPVDFFLLETFNTITEAEIAAKKVAKTGRPFAVSFTAGLDGNILNGDTWENAVVRLAPLSPLVIMVNCVAPDVATHALGLLAPVAKAHNIPFGAYANGTGVAGGEEGWLFSQTGSPVQEYAGECKKWQKMGATVIGGCCGTSPEYTKLYSQL